MQILKFKFISSENKKECGRRFFSLLKELLLRSWELIRLDSFRFRDLYHLQFLIFRALRIQCKLQSLVQTMVRTILTVPYGDRSRKALFRNILLQKLVKQPIKLLFFLLGFSLGHDYSILGPWNDILVLLRQFWSIKNHGLDVKMPDKIIKTKKSESMVGA